MDHSAGLLLAPAEGFDFRSNIFLYFGQRNSFLCMFLLISQHFYKLFCMPYKTTQSIQKKTLKDYPKTVKGRGRGGGQG